MVNVDIDKELYEDIKRLIKKNRYDYPSVKFFVQKSVCKELLNSKKNNEDFDQFYSKLKEILRDAPELKSKIDEAYAMELKKAKRGLGDDD